MQRRQALEGIKVADFSWAGVGPITTKQLGDHGAKVVRIESTTNVDAMRTQFPFAGGIPGIERSGSFAVVNNNKYSLALNLKHPGGVEIAKKLIAWSDVVIENFRPKTMEKWGLAYDDLVVMRPDIIMVSASMQGQTGPHAMQVGLGPMLTGLTGFTYITGWPDRLPVGIADGYTDFIAPWYLIVAIIGALDYRRRTGKGQYIEMSQFESGLSFLAPAVLDYTVNDKVQQAMGNRSDYAAPHGAYRCQGDDRWCVIAIFSDEEWRTFIKVIGKPEWSRDPRFATILGRKEYEDELDRLVEMWTVHYSVEEVMHMMQAAGIAAGVVENGRDLHEDPQLEYRQHFWELEHPEMGVTAYEGPSFKLSKAPAELGMPAPLLGQHTEYVCTQLLGMSDEEFVELNAHGVFE